MQVIYVRVDGFRRLPTLFSLIEGTPTTIPKKPTVLATNTAKVVKKDSSTDSDSSDDNKPMTKTPNQPAKAAPVLAKAKVSTSSSSSDSDDKTSTKKALPSQVKVPAGNVLCCVKHVCMSKLVFLFSSC